MVLRKPTDPVAPQRGPNVQATEKSCYGYGFSHLQGHDSAAFGWLKRLLAFFSLGSRPSSAYRWSRRHFGFYLHEPGLATVRLSIRARSAIALTCWTNGVWMQTEQVTPGEHEIDVRVAELRAAPPMYHLGFTVSGRLPSPNARQRRGTGVQLKGLSALAQSNWIVYPISRWRHNPVREESSNYQVLFRDCLLGRTTTGECVRNAQLNARERTAGVLEVTSTPLKLYVELAWLCNLRCPSCFQAYVQPRDRRAAAHFMSPWLLERISRTLFPGALVVWFNGNGESLLHPNINAVLRAACNYQFIPALCTNGSRFTEENMKLLVEAGFCVTLSVDSPYAEDYQRLRRGASFGKLVSAIAHLQDLKVRLKEERFNLRIQCVAQQSNLDQLSDLVRWAHSFGISDVQFLPLNSFGAPHGRLEDARLQHTPGKANEEMLKALRTGSKLGVRVRPCPPLAADEAFLREWQAAVDENLSRPSPMDARYGVAAQYLAEHPSNRMDRLCHAAWSECFLGVDGTVAPCDLYLSHTAIGNLHDDDFWTLWNGEKMQEMRRTVNCSPAGLCRHGVCSFRPAT